MIEITIEERLIGGILLTPHSIEMVSSRLTQGDFASAPLGRMYATMQAMVDAGKPIELLGVRDELKRSGILAQIGGDATLGRMSQAMPHVDSIRSAADDIRNSSAMRRLARLGRDMVDAAGDPRQSPQELIRRIEAEAARIQAGGYSDALVSLHDATKSLLSRLREPDSDAHLPVKTGLWPLDQALGGLYAGELVILAARPSIGKSAMASQVAVSAASQGGILFVSLEMNPNDIATRHLAAAIGVEVRTIRAGMVSSADLIDGDHYANSINGLPMQIHFGRSCTVSKIRGLARLMASRPEGLKLVVVDYLGLMAATDRRKPRWEQVSEISADLKSLAQELSVPVLACCQLNREAENKTPTLAQLRDSGSIEQDADVVLLLHRETRDATEAIVDVAKARNGATGEVKIAFDPATTTFGDHIPREWF